MSGVVIAGGSLANLIMFAAVQPDLVPVLLHHHPVVMAILFLVPIVGGVAALLGLPGVRQQSTIDVLDRLWGASVFVTLGSYLWLLLSPPGDIGTEPGRALIALLTSYWMCATALSSVVLPMWGRLTFLAIVFLLLSTLPIRYGLSYASSDLVDVLYLLCFNLPLLMGISWVYKQADGLDAASEDFRKAQLVLADEEARNTARRRSNEFIHDHVLSVLTAIAQHQQNSPELQKAAQETMSVIHRSESAAIRTARDITTALSDMFPRVWIDVDHRAQDFQLGAAGDALLGAAVEAIVNARQHGRNTDGREPETSVMIKVEGQVIQVTVQDRGRGFSETDAVEPGRFGIDQGIRARMEDVGGKAEITSIPNRGTKVTLTWSEAGPLVAEQSFSLSSNRRWLSGISHSLDTNSAVILVVVLFSAYAAIIALDAPGFLALSPSIVALLLYSAVGGALLYRRWPRGRLTAWAAVLAIVVAGGANYLALQSVPPTPEASTFAWSLGLTALAACGLLVRERQVFAWALLGLLFVTTFLWAIQVGFPVRAAAVMVFGQVVTLLFWNLIVSLSARAVMDLALVDQAWVQVRADQLILSRVRRKMDEVLSRVRMVALPVIEPVASGLPLTPELSLEARLLEAELRDGIRAASFTGTPIATAARKARERGVDVVLLDESTTLSAESSLPQSFQTKAVEALSSATTGPVVVRLLPPGRSTVGTIYGEGVLTEIPRV